MAVCNICPRNCNIDRSENVGFCGMTDTVKISRAALHMWEEPCISGNRGSGTVFFSGCSLKCVFCQNTDISHGNFGKTVSPERLREIFFELIEKGDMESIIAASINAKKRCVEADEFELTEVVRQKKGNDIVESAQKMRQLYVNPQTWKWAKFPFRNYKNIHIVESQAALIDMYIKRAKKVGYKNATLLGLSNKQCDTLTNILRPAFGISSERVTEGDLLLVTQNNFISGLMNGDIVVVKEVRTPEYRAGLHFLPVTVEELETKLTYSQLMVEEILYNNQTNLTQTQQKDLFVDFYKRMRAQKIKQNSLEFNDMMLKDPYLNALRAVYGYALTCHKAQGGEWEHVYLDIPRHLPGIEKPYVYQWIYTAMTRASKELYVVNDFWIM